jgi:type IV pilus assembly protein PilM
MAKKLNSVLGVDIGSQRIKVAEIRTQGRDAVVTALGMIATPEGAVDHTGVYNPDAVAAAIKQCAADAGATAPFVVASISGQASVLVRTLEVPRMNPTELKEHMQWEINRNIPFAESTVVSDFRPLTDRP